MQILLQGENFNSDMDTNVDYSSSQTNIVTETNNTNHMAMTEESEGSDKENNIIKMEVTDGNPEMPPMREDDSGSDDISCEQLDDHSKPCNNDISCEQPDGSSKQCNNDISCEQPDCSGSDGILCEPEDSSKQCKNDILCEQPDGSGSDGISGEQEESSRPCTNEFSCEEPDDSLKPTTNDISCEKSDDSSKSCTNDISCEQPDDSSKPSTNDICSDEISCEKLDDSSKSCTYDTEKQISDISQVCANGIQEQNGNNDNSLLSQSGGFEICTNNNVDKDSVSDCTGNETGQENIDDSSEVPSDSKVNINDIAVGDQVCPESQKDHLKNQIDENFTNGALETEGSLKNSTEENDLQINDISERIESKQLQDDGNLEKTESSQLQNGDRLEKTVDSSQLQTDDSLDNSLDDSTDSGLNVNDSLDSCSKEEQLYVDNSGEVGENVSQLQSDGGSEECLNELYIDENCDPVTIETDLINSAQSKSNDKLEVCINNTQVNTGENSELDISNTKLEIDEETELPVHDSLNLSSTDPQSHVDNNVTVGADRDDNDSARLTVDSGSRSIMTTEQSSQTDEIIEPSKEQPTHQPSKKLTFHHDNSNEIKLQKEVSVLQDQLGQSKMLVTSLQDQVGQSNMLMTSLQDQLGQSKILVTSLQEQLSQSKMLVKKLQSALIVQQAQSNHVITGLKQQLQRNQDEMKKQRIKYDRQLGEVISHMLFLEGQLKKSKKQINQVLKEKDDVIIHQKNQISSLTSTNDKLLQAVREIYGRKQGKNGVVHDGKHLDEEPVSSPSVKEKDKVKTHDKSRFSSLKEKLRRHRSSLDLTDADINVKSGLMNSRQYSSQENLLSIGKRNREARAIRDKKCRSIAGYPDGTLADLILEVPDETESRNGNESLENIGPDFEHWKRKYLGTSMSSETVSQSGSTGDIFVNGHSSCSDFDERSTGSLSGSMPILSERDTNANMSPPKERPHSVSSFEQLHVHDDHSPPDKSPASSPTNTSFSEKNPFKNLKTILKRKGSKMKSHKKRTVSMSQPPAVQNQDSMKKHFEKYDMS